MVRTDTFPCSGREEAKALLVLCRALGASARRAVSTDGDHSVIATAPEGDHAAILVAMRVSGIGPPILPS